METLEKAGNGLQVYTMPNANFFSIESVVNGSQLGTTIPGRISEGSLVVPVTANPAKLTWSADYCGIPEIDKMDEKGFILRNTRKNTIRRVSDTMDLVLCEDKRTGRICLQKSPEDAKSTNSLQKLDFDRAHKYFEWLPVRVINGNGAFLLKNLASGKCLQNMGVGAELALSSQDMENKSQWWHIINTDSSVHFDDLKNAGNPNQVRNVGRPKFYCGDEDDN
ncbi:uncharacterized protein LOC110849772 [Folsomia candida]|uniref:uncharacterized protein LOC110849772 n=1 Tax=Folsomia candida TaxID=158441 RepID=UPI000B8F2168|nr:uncharacterized protein LOC110849772 [Folsomia candida]